MENRFLSLPTKKVYSSYEIHTSTEQPSGRAVMQDLLILFLPTVLFQYENNQ